MGLFIKKRNKYTINFKIMGKMEQNRTEYQSIITTLIIGNNL